MTKYPPVALQSAADRIRVVRHIFGSVSRSYDFLNGLLSLRLDAGWRAVAAERMRFPEGGRLLDVACGTADLAIRAALRHPGITVSGIDFSAPMLESGEKKIAARGLGDRISLRQGDAIALPYAGESFDVAAIAFGLRNIPDRRAALKEMARVTAPGGQVMVLEMSFAPSPGFKWVYGFYLANVLPRVAALFSPDPAAYWYLADSIMRFPRPDLFRAEMREAGLKQVECRRLSFGAAHLHVGRIPQEDR
jgi:demethylmenaquinone methyltransferase/2-methoxy-6-polyprenyl-1,4-benzoquinol methylase